MGGDEKSIWIEMAEVGVESIVTFSRVEFDFFCTAFNASFTGSVLDAHEL